MRRSFLGSSWQRSCSRPGSRGFAIDAPQLYEQLYPAALAEAEAETLGWVVAAAYDYQELRGRQHDNE